MMSLDKWLTDVDEYLDQEPIAEITQASLQCVHFVKLIKTDTEMNNIKCF